MSAQNWESLSAEDALFYMPAFHFEQQKSARDFRSYQEFSRFCIDWEQSYRSLARRVGSVSICASTGYLQDPLTRNITKLEGVNLLSGRLVGYYCIPLMNSNPSDGYDIAPGIAVFAERRLPGYSHGCVLVAPILEATIEILEQSSD